jgi:hypothetical protein
MSEWSVEEELESCNRRGKNFLVGMKRKRSMPTKQGRKRNRKPLLSSPGMLYAKSSTLQGPSPSAC